MILGKSVESRKSAQVLDSSSYMKKVLITNKVTEILLHAISAYTPSMAKTTHTLAKPITRTSFSHLTNFSRMKRGQYLLIFLCYLFLHSGEILAAHKVVLVVSSQSPITAIDSLSLRKIYLGITYRQQGKIITGLINATEKKLNQVFLQSIASMSERSYRRRLLSMALKFGKPRLPLFNDRQALLSALLNDPYSISYMWQDDVNAIEDSGSLKILKTIWEE